MDRIDFNADGRRPWERMGRPKENQEDPAAADAAAQHSPRSKDATGQSGTQIDLSG